MILLIQNYIDGLMYCLHLLNKRFCGYDAKYIFRLVLYTSIHFICSWGLCCCNFYLLLSIPFIQNILWSNVVKFYYNLSINLHVIHLCNLINTYILLFTRYYISVKIVKYLRDVYKAKIDNRTIFILIHVVTKSTIKQCIQKYCLFFFMYILRKINYTYFQSARCFLFIETDFWVDDLKKEQATFVIKTLIENKKWKNIIDYQFMQSFFTVSFDVLYQTMYAFCVYIYFTYCTVNIMLMYIQYINLFHIMVYEYTISYLININVLREQNWIRFNFKCVLLYYMLNHTNTAFTVFFYCFYNILHDMFLEVTFFTRYYTDIIQAVNYYS